MQSPAEQLQAVKSVRLVNSLLLNITALYIYSLYDLGVTNSTHFCNSILLSAVNRLS